MILHHIVILIIIGDELDKCVFGFFTMFRMTLSWVRLSAIVARNNVCNYIFFSQI